MAGGEGGRSGIFLSPWVTYDLPSRFTHPQGLARNTVNRTVWTNNQAFKSGPLCFSCNETETMEHLLYMGPCYSEILWLEIGQILTSSITQYTNEYTARIELTPKEIIFNKPHPTILLRINYNNKIEQRSSLTRLPFECINFSKSLEHKFFLKLRALTFESVNFSKSWERLLLRVLTFQKAKSVKY